MKCFLSAGRGLQLNFFQKSIDKRSRTLYNKDIKNKKGKKKMKIYLAFVAIDEYTERVMYVSTDKNLLEETFQPNDDDRWIMEVDLTDKKIVDVW